MALQSFYGRKLRWGQIPQRPVRPVVNVGARKIPRARILLLADEGRIDKEIASFLGCAVTTVERVRKRFVEEGLEGRAF